MIKYFLIFCFFVVFLFSTTYKAAGDQLLTRDEQVVAATLLGEARGEGRCGLYAVGCVIQQRSINRELSPAKICLQNKQFSCWNGVTLAQANIKYYKQGGDIMYARELARRIVHGDKLDRSYVGFADHFHVKSMKKQPYWAKNQKSTTIVGNHKFYKLK